MDIWTVLSLGVILFLFFFFYNLLKVIFCNRRKQ